MIGGALPIIVWGLILLVWEIAHFIWTGDGFEILVYAGALVPIIGLVIALVLHNPAALRRARELGRPRAVIEALPRQSAGAMLVGTGVGAIGFGFAFGHFIIYFGAGMVIAGAGRLLGEWRAQRAARRAAEAGGLR